MTAGIRDILPGEMKELMNKVTEAKKAAEASLITRREETAAMRMQANTAKILVVEPDADAGHLRDRPDRCRAPTRQDRSDRWSSSG